MRPLERTDGIVALLLFATVAALYATSLAPTLTYGGFDKAELTVVAARLGLAHPTGYPLFTWLGFLASLLPIGEVVWRVAAMSAVLGAGGVALLYVLCRQLDLRRTAAAFAALLFGISPTFVSQTAITEVYAPNLFFVALTLSQLLAWGRTVTAGVSGPRADWRLGLVALLLGASLGTHMSNLAFGPAFVVFVLLTDAGILARPRTLACVTAAFLVGAAQFVWLPLRAHAFDVFPNPPPDTLAGLYDYTIGAFRNLRFAFPMAALPSRVVVYGRLLVENFTPIGVALGYLGMWVLWWRRAAAFWLLVGMYVVHVTFFTQLAVLDLDAFFIPSHLLFAVFVGVGLDTSLAAVLRRHEEPRGGARCAVGALVIAAVYAPLVGLGVARFRADRRQPDTSLADYYENVFDMLPPGGVLLTARGAFGSDVAYWHGVCGRRPDVTVPAHTDEGLPRPGAPLFTTRGTPPYGAQTALLPAHAWYVPVLVGSHRDLVLYRVQAAPPPLTLAGASPRVRVDRDLGGLTLVGYDVEQVRRAPPARVHLRTYWRVAGSGPPIVSTRVDDVTLEAHELGFPTLLRYLHDVGHPPDDLFVEAFDLVLPSRLRRGRHTLRIGHVELGDGGITPHWIDLAPVEVE